MSVRAMNPKLWVLLSYFDSSADRSHPTKPQPHLHNLVATVPKHSPHSPPPQPSRGSRLMLTTPQDRDRYSSTPPESPDHPPLSPKPDPQPQFQEYS